MKKYKIIRAVVNRVPLGDDMSCMNNKKILKVCELIPDRS